MPNRESFEPRGKRIWVSGHRGMVGSAIVRRLQAEECEVLTVDRDAVDLKDQVAVSDWVRRFRPQAVIVAAARVGGILANDRFSADFLYDNLMIASNTIEAAHRGEVEKLLFLGSSCIYPRLAPQPISEDALLTGPLETTNEWYAVAKIAGIKLCQAYRRQHGRDFISGMPTNLYGIGDNFNLDTSHVIPALLRKVHEAKQRGDRHVMVWGSGTPRREFMNVDDCADACVYLLKNYSDAEHINIGFGEDLAILELAELICEVVGFDGRIELDRSKPDGTPRKLMNSAKMRALGWKPRISLRDGLSETYAWFQKASGAAPS